MKPSTLIFIALFINLLGFIVVRTLFEFYDFEIYPLIPYNDFTAESEFESFTIISAIIFLYFLFIKEDINLELKEVKYNILPYALIMVLLVLYFVSINWSFDYSGRGEGQFDRSLFDMLKRLKTLIHPLIALLLFRSKISRGEYFFMIFIILIIVLEEISNGNRRELGYLGIILIIFLNFKRNKISKLWIRIIYFTMISIFGVSFFLRGDGSSKSAPILYFLYGLLTSIGTSGILYQVKYYVATNTGFLFGRPFVTYFSTLFVPSFIIYLILGNDFTFRSSYYFNDLYNTSEDMGYDFMMLADFYWNFGYVGYILFILLTLVVLKITNFYISNKNPFSISKGIVILMFFISGLRSDFGVFLKMTTISVILLWFAEKCFTKTIKIKF